MARHHETNSHSHSGALLHPIDFIRLIRTHVRWWLIPAVGGALLAGTYSLVASRDWRASQALIVRPEAASVSEERLGKFSDLAEMKTLQETILELAKSPGVTEAALRDVGPPNGYRRPTQWPTQLDIESFRDDVDMRPPGGAEFGKTEVFYLSVRNSDRDRAVALVAALCDQLQRRMKELRDQSARGMIAELERTVAMADGDLATQIGRLSKFEAKIGADLAELRNLNADTGNQGGVSQELQAIDTERRANESHLRESQQLLKLLIAAKNDPQQLLATPNSLLSSQPAVSQLKNALVTAQVHTANVSGSRTENHPFVISARESENLIRHQLNNEIAVAIRGLQVDVDLSSDRDKSLSAKYEAVRTRMSRLADSRAQYANLVASVQNYTRLAEAARKNLADARARQAGAQSASVISRIDGVQAGSRPIGPSRKTIIAAGGFGGLLLGFGCIFLLASPVPSTTTVSPGSAPTVENADSDVPAATNEITHLLVNEPGDCEQNGQPIVSTSAPSTRSSNRTFGMFRGMSLQEAIRSVKERG